MKKSLKKLCIFMVSLMAVVTVLSGCTPKKDLTGKWKLNEVTAYGFVLKADDYKLGEEKLSEVGFEVLDAEKVQFNHFSELFDFAVESVLAEVWLTKDMVEKVLPTIKLAMEKQGLDTSDLGKYYDDLQKQDYKLSGDKFVILTEGQTVLEGTLTDDNTITVNAFGLEDVVLKFTR